MKRRIHHSDEEWMQLITSCRQSGLSDKEWCVSNGIVVSSFYNAVVRLRKKACQIPEREQNSERIYAFGINEINIKKWANEISDKLSEKMKEAV